MSENYNDKNIKKILESENVPQELKPESIKIMLDKFSGERKNKINFKRTAMRVIPIAADRKSTRLNSSHNNQSRMPSSA